MIKENENYLVIEAVILYNSNNNSNENTTADLDEDPQYIGAAQYNVDRFLRENNTSENHRQKKGQDVFQGFSKTNNNNIQTRSSKSIIRQQNNNSQEQAINYKHTPVNEKQPPPVNSSFSLVSQKTVVPEERNINTYNKPSTIPTPEILNMHKKSNIATTGEVHDYSRNALSSKKPSLVSPAIVSGRGATSLLSAPTNFPVLNPSAPEIYDETTHNNAQIMNSKEYGRTVIPTAGN